eukprot:EG_transcript_10629
MEDTGPKFFSIHQFVLWNQFCCWRNSACILYLSPGIAPCKYHHHNNVPTQTEEHIAMCWSGTAVHNCKRNLMKEICWHTGAYCIWAVVCAERAPKRTQITRLPSLLLGPLSIAPHFWGAEL